VVENLEITKKDEVLEEGVSATEKRGGGGGGGLALMPAHAGG